MKDVLELLGGREFNRLDELLTMGDKAVPGLRKVLASQEMEYLRYRAAIALGRIGARDAVEDIARVLEEGTPYLRAGATRALGHLGGRKAEAHLLGVLDDPDAGIRKLAIRGLAASKNPEVRQALQARLGKEPEMFLRKELQEALRRLG